MQATTRTRALVAVAVVLIAAVVVVRTALHATPAHVASSPTGVAPSTKTGITASEDDHLDAISFLTPTRGYGLVVKSGATQCTAEVGASADGGVRFTHLVPVTTWACADSAVVESLAFGSDGDGFLYGPELFVTHDGGGNWPQIRESGEVLDVVPLGSSVWMLQALCPSQGAQRCSLQIQVSHDGGRTWPQMATAPPVTVSRQFGGAQVPPSLDRASRSSAYLITAPAITGTSQPTVARLWYTSDGGAI